MRRKIAGIVRWMFATPLRAVIVSTAVIGISIFAFAFFQPHKLFIDDRVDEVVPSAPSGTDERADPEIRQLAQADFRGLEHETNGRAVITEVEAGERLLSLVDFETSNGPDLRVYLSAGDSDALFGKEYGRDFVELGRLKGNIGDQSYEVPPGVDLTKYRNAVIWCKRFSVGFGVATFPL